MSTKSLNFQGDHRMSLNLAEGVLNFQGDHRGPLNLANNVIPVQIWLNPLYKLTWYADRTIDMDSTCVN
jgi:hypothetical protein